MSSNADKMHRFVLDVISFLACIECGYVVMRIASEAMKENPGDKNELMITICHTCDKENSIGNAITNQGTIKFINQRMIETWYVYQVLKKLTKASVVVKGDGNGKVRLINRSDFIHDTTDEYELTSIDISPNDEGQEIATACRHLMSGFF